MRPLNYDESRAIQTDADMNLYRIGAFAIDDRQGYLKFNRREALWAVENYHRAETIGEHDGVEESLVEVRDELTKEIREYRDVPALATYIVGAKALRDELNEALRWMRSDRKAIEKSNRNYFEAIRLAGLQIADFRDWSREDHARVDRILELIEK